MIKIGTLSLNLILLGLLIITVAISLFVGRANFDWWRAFGNGEIENAARIILLEIRMPRTIMAALAGGGLALSGAVLQSYLRNPLADSGVLGIGAFAALGAVIAIYFGLSAIGFWVVPLLAICFAGLALILLLIFAGRGGAMMFILAGVVLSALAGGLLTLALSLAPNPYALSEMIDWQIGGFSDVSLHEVAISAPLIILGVYLLLFQSRALEALIIGDDGAQSLGLDLGRMRFAIVIGIGLTIGAITAICGTISFVGLIVPHLIRPMVHNRPSKLLMPSLLFGAVFTLSADILVRLLWFDTELKLGVIMTLLGTPFFLWLLLRLRKKGWQP